MSGSGMSFVEDSTLHGPSQHGQFIGAIIAVALALCLALVMVLTSLLSARDSGAPMLLALAVLLALVVLWPAFVSMRIHGTRFDLFHPLFYAAWFFFIPQFVFASLIIASGTETSTALLLPDPWTPRMAAVGAAIVGSIGLGLGYFLPVGRSIGRSLPSPEVLDWTPEQVKLPAVLLLFLGMLGWLEAFRAGLLGFQFSAEVSTLGATFAYLSRATVIGQAAIWFSFFRHRRGWWVPAMIAAGVILVQAAISGNRATLLISLFLVAAGYQYSQQRLRVSQLWKWGLVAAIVLALGMMYGSYFRLTKNEQLGRTASMDQQGVVAVVGDALEAMSSQSAPELAQFTWDRVSERMDDITHLAVILVYAPSLADAEVSAGIDQNIIRDFASAFIPRVLWESKPVVGGHEQIGYLYFNTQYTSPAVTYMGDLYRNFGPWGILPGMLIVGVALRSLYVWLLEGRAPTALRVGLFMSLGLVTNYESVYSGYFPALIRTLAIALLALVLVKVLGRPRPRTGGVVCVPRT